MYLRHLKHTIKSTRRCWPADWTVLIDWHLMLSVWFILVDPLLVHKMEIYFVRAPQPMNVTGMFLFYFHMMTSSTGNIFCVTGPLWGNSPVTGEFPSQRPVTRSFDVLCYLHLNKQLCKQWWGFRFETPSRLLWRHCNERMGYGGCCLMWRWMRCACFYCKNNWIRDTFSVANDNI